MAPDLAAPTSSEAYDAEYSETTVPEDSVIQESLRTLAQHIEAEYTQRKAKRSSKEAQWLLCEELYLGSAASKSIPRSTSDRPFATQSLAQRPPELNIIGRPVDAVVSMLWSKQFAGGDKNWDILPSARPTDGMGNPIPPALAAMAAQAMEDTIEDQLRACLYPANCRDSIVDRVKLGTSIMKGPFNLGRMEKKYKLGYTSDGQPARIPQMSHVSVPCVGRCDPWFVFLDETVVDPSKNEEVIELHPWSRSEMYKASMNPNFMRDVIFEILREEQPEADLRGSTNLDNAGINDNNEAYKDKYQVLEYYGPVDLKDLQDLQITPTYESPDDIYYAEVWVCKGRVIRMDLHPIEGCFSPPYTVVPYIPDPGSQYGIGLPLLLADQQLVINRLWKMSLDNASISSGPQVVINKQNVKPQDGKWLLNPDKIWYNTEYSMGANAQNAISFFVPPNVTQEIMGMLNAAKTFAQEESGIPLMQAGLQSPQIQQTATLTQQLSDPSSTPLDWLNEKWDDLATEKHIRGMVDWNMQNNPDESIKGDFEIDVKTSSDLRSKQMFVGDLEKLSIETAQNPEAGIHVNQDELYRARLSMMRIPHKLIVRTPEEVEAKRQEIASQPNPEMEKLQLERDKMELEKQKMQVEVQRMQVELQKVAVEAQTSQAEAARQQQLAQWDHEEKMSANLARLHEAQAQVITAATQERIEYLKLAQKDGTDQAKILTEMNKIQLQDDRERVFKGIDAALKTKEMSLTQQELELARTSPDNDGI